MLTTDSPHFFILTIRTMERYLWTNGAIRVSEANEFCVMSEQESDIVRWVSMKKWAEPDGSISYTTFIGQMSVLVFTGSLLVTALDRFFLVFYPLKRIITLRIVRFLIGVIWIFAIGFRVPLFKMTTLAEFKPDFHVCTFYFGIIGYVIIYLLFCYPVLVLLPIIAIILIYAAIGFKLKHTIAPGNQLPSNQHRR